MSLLHPVLVNAEQIRKEIDFPFMQHAYNYVAKNSIKIAKK